MARTNAEQRQWLSASSLATMPRPPVVPLTGSARPKIPLTILYGTESGNTEGIDAGPAAERYGREIAHGITPIARWGEPADVGRTIATAATDHVPFSVGK